MLLIRFVLTCVQSTLAVMAQVLAEGSYVLINLLLQRFLLPMTDCVSNLNSQAH